jgi:hypothetical protein
LRDAVASIGLARGIARLTRRRPCRGGSAVVAYVALDMIWRGMTEVMNAAAA